MSGSGRQRNPRGRGERLRTEIIDAASAILAESADPGQLTLRSVARRVGIAATSVYLQFASVEELTSAVAERHFVELGRGIRRASESIDDPALGLVAGCKAYCRWAVRHAGHYRILFETDRADLGPTTSYSLEQSAGEPVLRGLVQQIQRCQAAGTASPNGDPTLLAILVWTALHGIVSLRLRRPRFPWPPLDQTVEAAVRRLVCLEPRG